MGHFDQEYSKAHNTKWLYWKALSVTVRAAHTVMHESSDMQALISIKTWREAKNGMNHLKERKGRFENLLNRFQEILWSSL